MTAKRFFDTNVVIYAYDDSEPTKQAVARSLLLNAAATTTGVISTQVLGDFGDEGFHLVGREFAWAARQPAGFRQRFAQRGNLPAGGIERAERDLRCVWRQLLVDQRGGEFFHLVWR